MSKRRCIIGVCWTQKVTDREEASLQRNIIDMVEAYHQHGKNSLVRHELKQNLG